VGVEPDVRVDDVHIRVLARDLLDGFDDVLTRGRVQQGDVGDLYVHRVLLGERERAQHVGFRHHARDGVSSLRRDHQPGDVVVEHAFDDGLRGLVGGRGDDGARHDVVNGDIEHPVDVASAVAAALSLLIANDELDDVVGGDDADEVAVLVEGGEPGDPVLEGRLIALPTVSFSLIPITSSVAIWPTVIASRLSRTASRIWSTVTIP